MSRPSIYLTLLAVAALALAGCAPASVEEEIAALDERMDTLEKQLQQVRASGGGGNAGLETEAQAAYTGLSQLVAAGNVPQAKAKLKEYGNKYAGTKAGSRIQSLGAELAVVGKDRPASWGIEKWFQGEDAINLASNDTTVVVFWESWCPHCRREVPKLQEMYDKYKDRGLQMIGLTRVNRSATEQAVKDIIAQNNVNYPMAKEDGSVAQYFAVSGIPAAAVVKNGKVVWRGHPARITAAMLDEWLS